MIKIKPTPKNIISILFLCDNFSKKEREEFLAIATFIKTKAYKKTMYSELFWRAFDRVIHQLPKEVKDSAIDDIENEIVLKEIIKAKSLFRRFLNQTIKETKSIKKEMMQLFAQLHKAKEDKALLIKKLLSQFATFLQLQREHGYIDKIILLQTTYYKTLTKRP